MAIKPPKNAMEQFASEQMRNARIEQAISEQIRGARIDHLAPEQIGGARLDQPAPEQMRGARRVWSGASVRARVLVLCAAVCVIAVAATAAVRSRAAASSGTGNTGSVSIESEPGGAAIVIDGQPRGTTPVSLTLPAGRHTLQLRQQNHTQEVSLMVTRAVSTVHHFTWPAETSLASTSATGSLRVATDGAAATVTVDGVVRGSTPVTVHNLAVGDHNVTVVRNGDATYRRTIRVDAAATASLLITNRTGAGPESGWFSVTAGVPLQIFEDGKLVGSTETDRILVPAGDHSFDFTNAALGFLDSQDVKIVAGVDKRLTIDLPQAAISINATPWAQVWLDGRELGVTPLGDVTTIIGSHELVFRHPQFGERRVTTVVTTREPARVAVDMRRSQ
jgi:hypothetical protein